MSAALENAILEEYAKFEGYKELLEDDLEEQEPDLDILNNAKENQTELKKQYLNIKVAQSKYKAKLVPASVTETVFNAADSHYKYNDTWLSSVKKDYQKVHKAVSAFLRREKGADEQKSESKLVVSSADEVSKLTNKMSLSIKMK